jgi:hypothetical protein
MDEASRDAKKRWKQAQREQARAQFPLPDPDLSALFAALDDHLERASCGHTLEFTRAWLTARGHDVDRVCDWLRSTGGYCDCEAAMNSRGHWEENR